VRRLLQPKLGRDGSAQMIADNYDGNPGQDGRPAGPALQV